MLRYSDIEFCVSRYLDFTDFLLLYYYIIYYFYYYLGLKRQTFPSDRGMMIYRVYCFDIQFENLG